VQAIDLAVKTPVKVIQEAHLWYVSRNLMMKNLINLNLNKVVRRQKYYPMNFFFLFCEPNSGTTSGWEMGIDWLGFSRIFLWKAGTTRYISQNISYI
jgi:hypothetical protein